MKYSVKEVFYTLQGEGINAGRSAVFLRFSGCNLWNGREDGRLSGHGGCSRWCDTNFLGTDGPSGGRYAAGELGDVVDSKWPSGAGNRLVVCTGGEPFLQMDAALVSELRRRDFEVAVETNGTVVGPRVDWLCVSPKEGTELLLREGDELKLVFPQDQIEPSQFETLAFQHFLLQPMDGPERAQNTQAALQYCREHPRWRLSLQTHKILGIP